MPAPSNQDGNTRYSQSRQAQPLHTRLASNDSSVQSYPASQISQAPRSSLNGKMLLDGYHGDTSATFVIGDADSQLGKGYNFIAWTGGITPSKDWNEEATLTLGP